MIRKWSSCKTYICILGLMFVKGFFLWGLNIYVYDRKTRKGHLDQILIGYLYRTGEGTIYTDCGPDAGCMTKVWRKREQEERRGPGGGGGRVAWVVEEISVGPPLGVDTVGQMRLSRSITNKHVRWKWKM